MGGPRSGILEEEDPSLAVTAYLSRVDFCCCFSVPLPGRVSGILSCDLKDLTRLLVAHANLGVASNSGCTSDVME